MLPSSGLAALGALVLAHAPSSVLALASPSPADHGMRLVKTTLDHDGFWVTEDEKFNMLISRHIHFVDITDTRDTEIMRRDRLHNLDTRQASAPPSTNYTYPAKAQHADTAKPLIASIDGDNQVSWAKEMTDMYSRYYRGCWATHAADWMFDAVTAAAASNTAIKVSRFTHKAFDQPSVIAQIPGQGDSAKKVVIVSAHYDSISTSPTARAPGADDNASGIVTILEALRVLAAAAFVPDNTLEFHFYGGEEGGTLGSRDIMQAYVKQKVNVIAMMNQDMTGYSPKSQIAVFTDFVDPALTRFIISIVPTYTDLPAVTDKCGYGCSDHVSAFEVGYPAAYVCDATIKDATPYIHSARDTYDMLSFDHILEHTKLTVGFLVEGAFF
ncbi:bacterial leucyl aminopeptidase [Microdochium nivale]|nr:bacterial leucyl aminopeptidase [Microdochium nivale]